MIDVKTADRELQFYIRPQTFPVAIRMLKPGEEIPEKAKRPARDFKKLSMNCQVIDMARRYGWMIALTREDHICSLGIAALGFEKPTHLHNSGTLCEGMYTATKDAGARSEAAVDKFAPGEYSCLLVAPLDRAPFEPHLVCVYANPAQVMRLTQAALWKRGGKLTSAFGGRIDCSEIIVTTMRTDQPQLILPCSGDRIFGQTQDHEMAFTIPWAQMEDIIEGLKGTHAGGIRYPITQFMEYEAKLPPRYMEANRVWDVEHGRAQYTPRDRVVAAYKRSFADRVPVYPIVASFAGTLDGLSIEEYCTNVPRATTAMLNYYERYQPDVVLTYNDLAKEAEAFGCHVKYSDYVVPSIDRHVLQDDKARLATLEIPDPKRDGRLPAFLRSRPGARRSSARRRVPTTSATTASSSPRPGPTTRRRSSPRQRCGRGESGWAPASLACGGGARPRSRWRRRRSTTSPADASPSAWVPPRLSSPRGCTTCRSALRRSG